MTDDTTDIIIIISYGCGRFLKTSSPTSEHYLLVAEEEDTRGRYANSKGSDGE